MFMQTKIISMSTAFSLSLSSFQCRLFFLFFPFLSLDLRNAERSRGFCTSSDKIVASVLFERLRVVIPKPDPAVYTFQEFKFNWQQQFRRRYPDEFLDIAKNRAKGEYQMECAESALKSVLGELTHTYFVGNAPMAHMVLQPTEESSPDSYLYPYSFNSCRGSSSNAV